MPSQASRWPRAFLLAVCALAALPEWAAAQAEPLFPRRARQVAGGCADGAALAAPAPIGVRATGIDVPRGACAVGGAAVVARLARAGELDVLGVFVESRTASVAGAELTVGARVVASREIGADDRDQRYGPLYLRVAHGRDAIWFGRPVTAGPSLRVDLPHTTTDQDGTVVAASPAYQATLAASDRVHLHCRAGALLGAVLADDTVDTRAALFAGVDAGLRLGGSFALIAGTEAQGGWLGDGFDHLLARAAARAHLGRGRVELAAALPVAGDEPTDLVLTLSAGAAY